MSKQDVSKKIKEKKKDSAKQEGSGILAAKYQDFAFILLLIVSVYVFLGEAIFSGGFGASDNVASVSMRPYVEKAAEDGEFPQWIPNIFSGMPSFGAMLTTGERAWDFIPEVIFSISEFFGSLLGNDAGRIAFFYALYAVGMYLLMRSKKHERYVSFFTSFAAVFSTCVIVWIMIGHNTKPVVFSMFPFVLLFLEKLRKEFSILPLVGLIVALHVMMEAGHVQMIFYGGCAFGLYLIFELISRAISKKEPGKVLRSAGMLVLAGGIAFLMSSDRYLSVLEYTEHSTRGSAPIVKSANQQQDASGGNDYDYATMWSYSPEEVICFFVPNFYGFGKVKYDGPEVGGKEYTIMTYWGQKPFDDAAAYMGIIVILFAVIGFVKYRNNVFVQFLFVLSIFSLFLSFGKNFSLLYDFFYYFVPSFNKFRAPSMALAMMQFAVPVLAGYGLSAIVSWRKEMTAKDNKIFKISLISGAAFLLLGVIVSAGFQDSYLSAFNASPNGARISQMSSSMSTFVWDQMVSDWFMSAFILLFALAMIYLFVKNKIQKSMFYIALTIILIFDLWRVGYRPMEIADAKIEETIFPELDYFKFLQADKSHFRIADFVSESPNVPAYYGIQSVNGYHSAKLRVYQDLLDVADRGSTSNVTNPFLWKLLNVKYILYPQPLKGFKPVFQSRQKNAFVFYNPGLPRAYFVDSVAKASQMDILKHMKRADFDPEKMAWLEEDLDVKLDKTGMGSKAEIREYKNEYIKIDVNAEGNNLLVLSEIYYPEGWKAYLDGQETEIIKTNYAFRSVVVPDGKHTLEMKFNSEGFQLGKSLSLAMNIFTVLLIPVGLFLRKKKKK